MKKLVSVERNGVGLRPATVEDSELILRLRGDPRLSQFMGPITISVEDQRKWMKAYEERPREYYYVITAHGDGVGTVGIYNYADKEGRIEAEWGRWVISPDAPVGPASVLLMFEIAFEHLGIDLMYCQAMIGNDSVIGFHDIYAQRTTSRQSTVRVNGELKETVFHEVSKESWPKAKKMLERLSRISLATMRGAE